MGKLRKTFSDVKDKMTAACNEIEFQFLVLRFAHLRDVDSPMLGQQAKSIKLMPLHAMNSKSFSQA